MVSLIANLGRILCAGMLATLVSCGGGGDGSGSSSGGSLTVTIGGLPNGVNAAVVVSGPNAFNQAITATRTLSSLSAGTHTLTAANVLVASDLYSPQPSSQSVAVSGAIANASVTYSAASTLRLSLQQVAAGLSSPLFLTAPANDLRLFVVEQSGRIRILQGGNLLATPFLDISARTTGDGERGLLSMAFHPQYATNGFFFVYFTDPNGDIAIERFQVAAANPDLADPSPVRILTIPHQVFGNHNGGLLAFGTDGFLYIGTGDGGGGGDPLGSGQNLNTLLGKLLRIDVSNTSFQQPYAIPGSNPFVNQPGQRGEIWAYGLRNPWRYAFDATTSLLYIADVGQSRQEEVNVADTATAGLNYGWNITEGSLCHPGDQCSKLGLTLPVLEYDHGQGCSITGGYVYRGNSIPELRGRYFYSDFCSGWLRSFVPVNGAATEQVDWNITNVGFILSFGEDAQKELYMLSSNGGVYRIVRQ